MHRVGGGEWYDRCGWEMGDVTRGGRVFLVLDAIRFGGSSRWTLEEPRTGYLAIERNALIIYQYYGKGEYRAEHMHALHCTQFSTNY